MPKHLTAANLNAKQIAPPNGCEFATKGGERFRSYYRVDESEAIFIVTDESTNSGRLVHGRSFVYVQMVVDEAEGGPDVRDLGQSAPSAPQPSLDIGGAA